MIDLNEYIIFQVCNAVIIDEAAKRVIAKTNLQSADIEVSTESKEVKAGQSNGVIATISASRNITVKLSEPTFSLESLAMTMGQDITTGVGVAYAMPETHEVGVGKTIKLKHVPIDGSIVIEGGLIATVTEDSKSVVITGATEGEQVKVLTYQYKTAAGTKTINIDNKKFATAKKLILETPVFDLEQNPAFLLQYEFPVAKPVENFTINTKSEQEAVVSNLELKILEKNGSQGVIRLIPFEESVELFALEKEEKEEVMKKIKGIK